MVSTNIKVEGNLLIISVTGDLTANEVIAVVEEYYSNGIIKDVIWDLTLGTMQSITGDGFKSIAKATKKVLANGSRMGGKTVFVGNSIIEYDYFRMYTVVAEITGVDVNYNVFKTLEEAKNWIAGDCVSPSPLLLK
jgi:hypothetical protein